MADNAKWYVIHTYSGYENAVKAAIEKSVVNRGMSDMVLKMEIPMETVTEVTESGVMKEVERKVFPGYVLIKMILTDDTWHLIRNIRGVTGFVGEANKAIPLTEDEVAALGVEKHEIVVLYNVGDTVKISDGPLASFTGTVEEIDPEKNKVRVVVSMFGRETPIELELDQVEVLHGRPEHPLRRKWERRAPSRQKRFPALAGRYHIFMKEVPIHGTESCWLCKAADPCRQSNPRTPRWPRSGPARREHRRFHQGVQRAHQE